MKLKHQGRNIGTLLFRAKVGSHSHGTNIEGSDEDFKGIFAQNPMDVLEHGYNEQFSTNDDDTTFELRRFIELCCKGNPTMLELLFTPEDCIEYIHPEFQKILDRRMEFLSKSCKWSFGGYARQQIQKASGLEKKMNWEKERTVRKTPIDFCWVVLNGDRGFIDQETGKPAFEDVKQGVIGLKEWMNFHKITQEEILLTKLNHTKEGYQLFLSGYNTKGIQTDDSNQLKTSETPKGLRPTATVLFNPDAYSRHCKDYKSYQEWLKNRNELRYTWNEQHNQQIDCYKESETEFLTKSGWKHFDEIEENDILITIDENSKFCESKILDKFDSKFTGNLYTFENRYSKFCITDNHKMWLAYLGNRNETGANPDFSSLDFEFKSVSSYFNQRKSWARILHTTPYPQNLHTKMSVLDDRELKLLGAYISDGTLRGKRLVIDQHKGRELCNMLKVLQPDHVSEYKNNILTFSFSLSTDFLEIVEKYVGKGSLQKRMDFSYFHTLSRREFGHILEYMLLGDGSKYSNHYTYYTSSKQLSEDLHTLLFFNNCTAQIYQVNHKGGFEGSSGIKYQVYIPLHPKTTGLLTKSNKNWSVNSVKDERIVCLTSETGILITRNSNKIAIQGNSKNMLHCVRLTRMGKEIAEGKGIIVRRPDADFLKSIRKGEVNLEELLQIANKELEDMDKFFETSDLPEKVKPKKFTKLQLEIRKALL